MFADFTENMMVSEDSFIPPLVTVLIATYNYERYIGDALNGILNQTYDLGKIEIVIVDDGSTDNTRAVVDQFTDRISIVYHYQENRGKASATRVGIGMSKGKYIFNLDADDYYYPDCLKTVVKLFEADNSLVQVSYLARRLNVCDNSWVDQSVNHQLVNTPIDGDKFLELALFSDYCIGLGSAFSARASKLKMIAIPDSVDMYIDLYLFVMLAPLGTVMQLDSVLAVFRRHPNAYSEGKDARDTVRQLRYLKSAEAIFQQLSLRRDRKKITAHYEYFYKSHLLSSKKCDCGSIFSIALFILRYSLSHFWSYRSRFRFLYRNVAQVFFVLIKK